MARIDLAVGAGTVTILNENEIDGNPAAFVLGPTGLAYDKNADILYVASTLDNAIYAVPAAGTRTSPVDKGNLVFEDPHLRGPLALAFAPNGDLVTTNGDAVNPDPTHPSEIVEFTKGGKFIRESNIDASQGGAFASPSSLPLSHSISLRLTMFPTPSTSLPCPLSSKASPPRWPWRQLARLSQLGPLRCVRPGKTGGSCRKVSTTSGCWARRFGRLQ